MLLRLVEAFFVTVHSFLVMGNAASFRNKMKAIFRPKPSVRPEPYHGGMANFVCFISTAHKHQTSMLPYYPTLKIFPERTS